MEETWSSVAGFDGYEVSSFGRVRSWLPARYRAHRPSEPRFVRAHKDKDGYLRVGLMRDRKKYMRLVHRLVLEAFVGPCPPGMEGCHDPDRSPENCRLDNLRWDTRKNNHNDKRRHGTMATGERCGVYTKPESRRRGELNGRASITDAIAMAVITDLKLGVPCTHIAAAMGIGENIVFRIKHRRSWAHLPR